MGLGINPARGRSLELDPSGHDGPPSHPPRSPLLYGKSLVMQEVRKRVRLVAAFPTSVLIEGPSGSGKELIARAIWDASPRRTGRFTALNCGALPESLLETELFGHRRGAFTSADSDRRGLFEDADGGTIFLDEIGEASPSVQVRLLRVLEEREVLPVGARKAIPVDVRIIAATNRDLRACVESGHFRSDLYYRLGVFPIRLPSLNERAEDIPLLADHLLTELARVLLRPQPRLSTSGLMALLGHRYEGNVRELRNLLERALVVLGDGEEITEAHLFDSGEEVREHRAATLQELTRQFEMAVVLASLRSCGGKKPEAAKRLGITVRWLHKILVRRTRPDFSDPVTPSAGRRPEPGHLEFGEP